MWEEVIGETVNILIVFFFNIYIEYIIFEKKVSH